VALPALAQVPPGAGTVAPGRVEQPFRPPTTPPPVGGAPIVPPGLAPTQAPPGAAQAHFILQKVVIDGATAISPADLAPLYQGMIGQDVTLQQIYDLAASMTAKYGSAGYILSQAVVPAQRIANGVVRIEIVEGFVDKITFKNETGAPLDDHLMQAYAAKISASRPLQASELERYLLLMNDLPKVSARSYMQPSSGTPGAADMVVVVERKTFDGEASIDNQGSKFLGPYEGLIEGNLNNVLGRDERTGIRYVNTLPFNELHYAEVYHDEQIDTEGTKATFDFYWTHANPGSFLTGLTDIDYSGSAQVTHPFIRSRAQNLIGLARFEVDNLAANLTGIPITNDHLRVLRTQLSWNGIDAFWNSASSDAFVEYSQGLPVFGAMTSLSRPGATATFAKFTGQVSRDQGIGGDFSVYGAITGQVSDQILPASEEFGFGGAQFGRGYDPSEILGDSGIAGKAELRWGQQVGNWLQDYQFYAFFDAGSVWSNVVVPGSTGQQTGTSTGAGARFNLDLGISGYAEVAVPLTRIVAAEGNKNPRFFFGVSKKF
jgi:hemolysin activation/secretion protein